MEGGGKGRYWKEGTGEAEVESARAVPWSRCACSPRRELRSTLATMVAVSAVVAVVIAPAVVLQANRAATREGEAGQQQHSRCDPD